MTTDWKKFVDATKDRKPNNYVIDAVRILGLKEGEALDIGCGSGVEAKYLAEQGFDVVAFDSNKESVEATRELTANLSVKALEQRMEEFIFDDAGYDFIIAWRSIPFVEKTVAEKTLLNIQKHLRPGGICVLALFGPEDAWAKERKDMSFFALDELKLLWREMKFIRVFEERAEGNLATGGTKFFHKIDCIAQKVN